MLQEPEGMKFFQKTNVGVLQNIKQSCVNWNEYRMKKMQENKSEGLFFPKVSNIGS
jgi:hypothetical protein